MESVRSIERMTVVQLRELAKERRVRLPYGVNKAQIVELLSRDEPKTDAQAESEEIGLYKPKPLGYYNEEYGTSNPVVPRMIKAGLLGSGQGVLEVQAGGYGFLRAANCSPGPDDIYVSIAQIRRFGLHSGDFVVGKTREKRVGDRYSALMYIDSVNGDNPEVARLRRPFDSLTPIHPNRRLTLENPEGESDLAMRLLDFIAPIGLGQRALIVAPPKAGKTVLLKKIAQAVRRNHPDIELIVLLIDERPEEVTELKRCVDAQVVYSTFDAPQDNHVRVADMVYERAQRLVEQGKHVVVLMDSLTRLARACNALAPGGRAMSGGLAPGVLQRPKRFFGAARNIEEGGSLTIIATVLVETGSRMDDVIFEEFKGTGNAEIRLDRALSEMRVFPAIDLARSGTRREELLLTDEEAEGVRAVRRILSQGHTREATQQLIGMLEKTGSNKEFFKKLQEWLAIWEKEGYTIRSLRSSV
ncbi:MAG: transcription termination factor Rho [Candidatus Ventricola sp.]|nr:transcription termination factor Rho [Candidatus Ventricola sp.]MDY4541434.1 transcription termination factor Rho [Candidatus Ventricola sp.]